MIIKHLEPDIENILIYDSVIHTGGGQYKKHSAEYLKTINLVY